MGLDNWETITGRTEMEVDKLGRANGRGQMEVGKWERTWRGWQGDGKPEPEPERA